MEEFYDQPLKTPNLFMLVSFSVVFILSLFESGTVYTLLSILSLGMIAYSIVQLNLKYKLIIEENRLVWITSLWDKELLTKKADAGNIKAVSFGRFGFYRIVLVEFKKGKRWRLAKFKPDSFDKSLKDFAVKNSIEVIGN